MNNTPLIRVLPPALLCHTAEGLLTGIRPPIPIIGPPALPHLHSRARILGLGNQISPAP